jgi:hypothetical protein
MMVNRGLGSPSQCGGPDRLLMSPWGGLLPFLICPACDAHACQSGHSLPEATTPDTVPISSLPLVAQRAEVYRRSPEIVGPRSRRRLDRGNHAAHSGLRPDEMIE